MSKACVDPVHLPPSPLSTHHTSHGCWVAGAGLAFDLACIISVGRQPLSRASVSGYALSKHSARHPKYLEPYLSIPKGLHI